MRLRGERERSEVGCGCWRIEGWGLGRFYAVYDGCFMMIVFDARCIDGRCVDMVYRTGVSWLFCTSLCR